LSIAMAGRAAEARERVELRDTLGPLWAAAPELAARREPAERPATVVQREPAAQVAARTAVDEVGREATMAAHPAVAKEPSRSN
jgi:hypothetical protein